MRSLLRSVSGTGPLLALPDAYIPTILVCCESSGVVYLDSHLKCGDKLPARNAMATVATP